tara:strand:- start:22968 stop:25049 length:2082 start_codon:yes stop_codon:yes gene_type:complete
MAKVGTVRFNIEADHARMSRQLAAANGKLSKFKSQTKLNMDGIRNSFVSAFGGFIVLNAVSSAVKSLVGFELQMDKVQAISGATNTQMKALTETALRLGRTSIFTASEVGKMEEELARLGFSTEKILASADAITKLALVTDRGLGESAKTVAGTLNGFNLIAEDSGRVANIMAEAFSSSALDLEKFTVGTANSSSIAESFGATLEENTARLGMLTDRQIDASKAGTDLRRMYINLNEKGLTWKQGMDLIANSTDQLGTAVELFDVRAAGSARILANAQEATAEAAKKFGDTAFEIDKKAKIMADNTSTSFKLFTSSVDGFIQYIGSTETLDALAKFGAAFFNAIGRPQFQKFQEGGKIIGEDFVKATERSAGGLAELKVAAESYRKAIDELAKKQKAFAAEDSEWIDEKTRKGQWDKIQKSIEQYTNILGPLDAGIKSITDKLEKEAAALLNSAKAAKEYAKQMSFVGRAADNSKQIENLLSSGGGTKDNGRGLGLGNDGFFATRDIDVEAGAKEAFDKTIEDGKKALFDLEGRAEVLKEKMVQMQVEAALGFTTSVIENGVINGIGAAFSQVLDAMGDGLIKLGIAAIAHSKIMEGIKASLQAGISNPIVGAAAGAAAIAAGIALKASSAAINQNTSGAAGGSGGVSGPSGRFLGGGQIQQNRLEGEFTVRGSDLVYILGRQGQIDGRQKAG